MGKPFEFNQQRGRESSQRILAEKWHHWRKERYVSDRAVVYDAVGQHDPAESLEFFGVISGAVQLRPISYAEAHEIRLTDPGFISDAARREAEAEELTGREKARALAYVAMFRAFPYTQGLINHLVGQQILRASPEGFVLGPDWTEVETKLAAIYRDRDKQDAYRERRKELVKRRAKK